MDIFWNWLVEFYLNNVINLLPLTAHYAKLYPQNEERIVTIVDVTSFHPVYMFTYYLSRSNAQQRAAYVWTALYGPLPRNWE